MGCDRKTADGELIEASEFGYSAQRGDRSRVLQRRGRRQARFRKCMRQGCCLAGWEVEVLRGDDDLDRGVNLRSGVKGRELTEHHAHVRGQLRAELAEASAFRVVEELEGGL